MPFPLQIKALLCIALLGVASIAQAQQSPFDDVTASTRFNAEIEALAELNIARGNGEGLFFPNDFLNRAELLAFAYRAAGKTPMFANEACFTDVPAGMWFSNYVCDAKMQGYVQGYPDGTFKPAQLVNRVEALKMIIEVLDLELESGTVPEFTDVDPTAWYYPYLATAFANNLVPSELYTFIFAPGEPLVRNEMAAITFNAYEVVQVEMQSSSSSSSDLVNTENNRPKTNVNFEPVTLPKIGQFPWAKTGTFDAFKPVAHTFTLTQNRTLQFTVEQSTAEGVQAAPNCTLYISDDTGFNYKYFLGTKVQKTCTIVANLEPGEYQWQINPTVSGASYSASATETSGDLNDGYHQAKLLSGIVQTHSLRANNTHNWYTFTATEEMVATVFVSNSEQVTCTIVPMEDVDLYGFTGPVCNESYTFPPGTYYVSAQRKNIPLASQVEYSIYRQ